MPNSFQRLFPGFTPAVGCSIHRQTLGPQSFAFGIRNPAIVFYDGECHGRVRGCPGTYTMIVGVSHGWNLLPRISDDIAVMTWPGRFNSDFTTFLLLSNLLAIFSLLELLGLKRAAGRQTSPNR